MNWTSIPRSSAFLVIPLCVGGCGDSSNPPPLDGVEVTVLTEGATIQGANGIRFDAQGRLHVASVFGSEVLVMDAETGEVIDSYGRDAGIVSPDDLAFDNNGNLYWTAIITGDVGRRTPDGAVEIIAQLPPGVNPIAISPDGRMVVGLCFLGDGLYEVDPQGIDAPRLIAENLGGGCGFNAFDFGPDGRRDGDRGRNGNRARLHR